MCTQWYDEGKAAMSQPVGEERLFTFVLKSVHPHRHTDSFTEGDLIGAESVLSRQAQVRCLHPGIKIQGNNDGSHPLLSVLLELCVEVGERLRDTCLPRARARL